MTSKQLIKRINKLFPPTHAEYPVAFHREGDDRYIVTTETTARRFPDDMDLPIADYYGEGRGNYPWIHPDLEKLVAHEGFYLEWENAACLTLWRA